jgi:pyruvate carboxylase
MSSKHSEFIYRLTRTVFYSPKHSRRKIPNVKRKITKLMLNYLAMVTINGKKNPSSSADRTTQQNKWEQVLIT